MPEVLCKLLPMAIMNFFFDVYFSKDFANDLRVRVAIRNHRPNIATHAESLENRFVEREVAVLRASKCTVKVEQNKFFHRHADICIIKLRLATHRTRTIDKPMHVR